MKLELDSTITRHLKRSVQAWLAIFALICIAAPVWAHGGFDHVRGTVVKVTNNVLTVKTAQGNVDVKLSDKTELTKDDQKAQLLDLTPGARVVVDIPEGSKDKMAHSVKIGAGGKTVDEHAEHDHHK
jgi:hypothetical protein